MLRNILIGAVACCAALGGFGLVKAQNAAQPASQTPAAADIPAYHATPPHDPLPATLDPKLFPDPLNQNVYALAAKEKKILYQQPCYCRCDREAGHKSLLDCYVDRHAAGCATCRLEAVFAYQESKKGKTAAQIRQEIMEGKWRNVDLSAYNTPNAALAK
ncbi:MAG TPA: CYCXC family (seleno)protein [Candidatus Acidoferrum sp.]|nr:CYCXC family (seleno)protein [Candidatus Acidoferrum sp.]